MAVLTIKNKQLDSFINARDLSSIAPRLIYGIGGVPPEDLSVVNSEPTFFYSSNELILSLDGAAPELPSTPDTSGFDFFDDLFTAGGRSTRIPSAGFRFSMPTKVRVNSFWNVVPDSDPSDFSNYILFDVDASIESSSSDKISLKISGNDRVQIINYYNSISGRKPEYGLLLVVIEFENASNGEKFENAYLLKYTHAPLFSSPALLDSFGSMLSSLNVSRYTSPGYTAETLFVPTLSCSFVYNFYEEEESNYSVYKERSYKNSKLEDIPKYVKITWSKPSLSAADFAEINNRGFVSRDFLEAIVNSGIRDAFRDRDAADSASSGSGSLFSAASLISGLGSTITPEIRDALRSSAATTPPTPTPPPPRERYSPRAIRYRGLVISVDTDISDIATAAALTSRSSSPFDIAPTIESSPLTDPALSGDSRPRPPADPSVLPPPTDVPELFAKTSDYIGFVMEKYRLSENAMEDYELVDIIAIPGRETTEYIDTKVAYGEIYQYKIRSIFRFVNDSNLTMYEDSDSVLTKKQSIDFVDTNFIIKSYKTFYYDSPNSTPIDVAIEESQRPEPPTGIKMFANSRKKHIFITWNQKNQNRDVIGFNLYRRNIKDSKLLKLNNDLIPPRDNFYLDLDVLEEVDYLYAVESVDIHGNFSKLSSQFYIRVKEIINFDDFSCEAKPTMLFESGREINDFLPRKEKDDLTVVKKSLKININPLFKNTDENNTFIVKITSLDTGMEKFVKLNFRTQTIYHVAPYVPAPRSLWAVEEFFSSRDEIRDSILDYFTGRS